MGLFSKSNKTDDHENDLAKAIAALLWDLNILGAKEHMSPEHEFIIEAKLLVKALAAAKDEEDFIYKLVDIFNENFGSGYEFDNSHELAKEIYKLGKQ